MDSPLSWSFAHKEYLVKSCNSISTSISGWLARTLLDLCFCGSCVSLLSANCGWMVPYDTTIMNCFHMVLLYYCFICLFCWSLALDGCFHGLTSTEWVDVWVGRLIIVASTIYQIMLICWVINESI
jgi:hypothetical protein